MYKRDKAGKGGRKRLACLTLALLLCLTGCGGNPPKGTAGEAAVPVTLEEEVLAEAEECFRYLWEQAQTDEASGAYGMVRDRYPGAKNISSIAATGFALASIPYGIRKDWISEEEGRQRAEKTLDTLLSLEQENGFFYHFINKKGELFYNKKSSLYN